MEKMIGHVKHYVFHNAENSYTIARFVTKDDALITIVGYFPKMSEEVTYELTGDWVNHPTYGHQFKVENIYKTEKQNINGLIAYLSSAFFTGIGPKTAERIVEVLGEDAIKKITEDKMVLKEVGLNAIRTEKFYQQLIEHQAHEKLLVSLYGLEISGKLAMKLINHYDAKTLDVLRHDPYQCISDIDGIGFVKADEIARKVGILSTDEKRLSAGILFTMDQMSFQKGDLFMYKDQLIDTALQILDVDIKLDDVLEQLVSQKKVVLESDRYYLASVYQSEISLAKDIQSLCDQPLKIDDPSYITTLLDAVEIQKGITYTPLQKEAIIKSLMHPFSIITGGPGTGKTTIIDGLLEVYRLFHKLDFKHPSIKDKIALMAPTGRAAKRMKELLNMEAKTIHRHLGFGFDGFFSYDESHRLPQQLIIVDESSMIDIFLAKKLFSTIKSDAQVIMVGDVDQLPSVGPGQVLSDFIESKRILTVRLKDIHRQAKDSYIVKLASLINAQELKSEDIVSQEDVYFYQAYAQQIKSVILKQVDGAIKKGYDIVEDIQVLIPMYKGDLGIDQVNIAMQDMFNPKKGLKMSFKEKSFYTGDKVIQLVNDSQKMIMNGDIGVIKKITKNDKDENIMIVSFDETDVMYEQSDLEELNLAYAMSIHKSQGSEYPIVIMPMVKPYIHMLKKELIYTAITRAKKYLILLGDMNLLTYAVNHLQERRQTTLAQKISLDLSESLDLEKETYEALTPWDFMS